MMETKSTHWGNGEGSTLSPVEELVEELPTMTVAGIAVVVLVVLLAIGVVFTLGVMLDCRQKKVLEKRLRRPKTRRRPGERDADVEAERAGIAKHMEPSGTSVPPAAAVTAAAAAPSLHTPQPYHQRAIAIV